MILWQRADENPCQGRSAFNLKDCLEEDTCLEPVELQVAMRNSEAKTSQSNVLV